MGRFPEVLTQGIGRWIAVVAISIFLTATADMQAANASLPVFAQISGVPMNPGSAGGPSADPTFQRLLMVAVCLAMIFALSLICYLVLFGAMLNAYWPRTAYAAASAIFWVGSTALILGMFWQSLKYRFSPGEAWYNEHGVRALVIAQGVVIALLFLFTKRSEGPFPVLIAERPAKPK